MQKSVHSKHTMDVPLSGVGTPPAGVSPLSHTSQLHLSGFSKHQHTATTKKISIQRKSKPKHKTPPSLQQPALQSAPFRASHIEMGNALLEQSCEKRGSEILRKASRQDVHKKKQFKARPNSNKPLPKASQNKIQPVLKSSSSMRIQPFYPTPIYAPNLKQNPPAVYPTTHHNLQHQSSRKAMAFQPPQNPMVPLALSSQSTPTSQQYHNYIGFTPSQFPLVNNYATVSVTPSNVQRVPQYVWNQGYSKQQPSGMVMMRGYHSNQSVRQENFNFYNMNDDQDEEDSDSEESDDELLDRNKLVQEALEENKARPSEDEDEVSQEAQKESSEEHKGLDDYSNQITDRIEEGCSKVKEEDEDGRLRWYISKKKQEMEQAQWGNQQNYFSNQNQDEEEAKTPSRDTFPNSIQQEPWSASQRRPLQNMEDEVEEDTDSDLNRYQEQLYRTEDDIHKEDIESLPPTVLQIETVSNSEAVKINKEIEERRRKSDHLFNPGHRRTDGRNFDAAANVLYDTTGEMARDGRAIQPEGEVDEQEYEQEEKEVSQSVATNPMNQAGPSPVHHPSQTFGGDQAPLANPFNQSGGMRRVQYAPRSISSAASQIESVNQELPEQPQQRVNNQLVRAGMTFEEEMQELFEYFALRIQNEREQIKFERDQLRREKMEFQKQLAQAKEGFDIERQQWEDNHRKVRNLVEGTRFVQLDIGGTHKLTTSLSTLTKVEDSALAALFSGRHQLHRHNGRVLIDRDGPAFCHLVSYLRNGKVPIFLNKVEEVAFREEMDFWRIPYPSSQLENETVLKFDKDWCASSLKLVGDMTVTKCDAQHGIVFANLPLDLNNSYIEYKVTMNWVSNGKSHLFVGLVDKSKYQFANLMSTYWKDSPSSYYWDVWMRKLIRTDQQGTQRGVITEYGCCCESKETRIGIYYDAHNRSVCYYKDGINQGVAFKNVASGYYPSIDIWFDSGKVEILPVKRPPSKQYL